MTYDYIVIGAGAAGLSFSALMEKRGYRVALLEAHHLPGGCSSFFERDGNVFDAGATTLSGLKAGRSLDLLMKELNLNLDCKEINPGLISALNGKEIKRYKNQNEWLEELNKKFPNIIHNNFWGLIKRIDDEGWDLSSSLKNFPLRSFSDICDFNFTNIIKGLKLIPYFFKSVSSYLNKIDSLEYRSFINELLFITAQNKSDDTPMLMGAMGLNYPSDTYYAMGGMKAFSLALAGKCSNLFYRHKVLSISAIENGKKGFCVQTTKGEFKAQRIVSTLPIWNHDQLFTGEKIRSFFKTSDYNKKLDECWSAFTIYFTLPLDRNRESLYYQIHCDSIPNCETKSFFASFSHPDDFSRSRTGRQVVTISTHTKTQQWVDLPKDVYKKKKAETSNFIIKKLCEYFKLESLDLENILTGSPTTFLNYTNRKWGLVGGIPHSLKRNPLKLIFHPKPLKNFYMIGDTQFPGQGISAVVLGAQNLVHHLTKNS
jgi:C-3',4' desaturase CrtD